MRQFISDEALERLIRQNNDASSSLERRNKVYDHIPRYHAVQPAAQLALASEIEVQDTSINE